MKRFIRWAGLGAAFMFFFDPEQGNRRRKMAVDRAGGFFRRTLRRGGRAGRAVSAQTYGLTQKVKHLREEEKELDDVTLARKVETEIFRPADVQKGKINVNVEEGVVVLRGEAKNPAQVKAIEAAARKVPEVVDVENLLHLPKTPARTAKRPRPTSSS